MTANVLSQRVKSDRRQGDRVLAFLRLAKLGSLVADPNGDGFVMCAICETA